MTPSAPKEVMFSGVITVLSRTSMSRRSTSRTSRFLKFIRSGLSVSTSVNRSRPPRRGPCSARMTFWPRSQAVMAACMPAAPPPTMSTVSCLEAGARVSGSKGRWARGLMVQWPT